MKASRLLGVVVIAVLFGSAIGFLLRRKNVYWLRVERTEAAHRAEAAVRASGSVQKVSESVRPFSVAEKLERDLASSKGVVQWLYWMEAIEKASLDDMPRLARL